MGGKDFSRKTNWYRPIEIVGTVGGLVALGWALYTNFHLILSGATFTVESQIMGDEVTYPTLSFTAAFGESLFFSIGVGGLIFAAWLLADFLSGLVHWFADTYGHSGWWVLGPSLIRPFREHHVDPMSITRHDFFETNGSLMWISGFAVIPAIIHPGELALFWTVLCFFTGFTNQIHSWAHEGSDFWFAKLLQKVGFILSPQPHHNHHNGELTKAYCITSGALNPILDRVQFFRRLEGAIETLFGVRPREEDLNE